MTTGDAVDSRPPDADLTPAEAVDYWDRRHARLPERSSGGHSSLGEAGNRVMYQIRLAQLLEVAGSGSVEAAPRDVLDAGCGKGILTRALAECGYRVHAFDPSESALRLCIDRAVGGDTYQLATMTSFRPERLYDLVYSVDVLFHIMDEDEWRSSVAGLCACVRLGGRIALVDQDHATPRRWGNYQRTRPPRTYFEIYESCGLRPEGTTRCGPPGLPNVFILGRRVA